MRKLFIRLVVAAFIIAGLGRASIELPFVQDFALDRGAGLIAQQGARSLPEVDGLRVYVCGSASPLGVTDQAQACVAVLTEEHFYIVDTGSGSMSNLSRGRLPMDRLQGILLTHFHSDHIAEIYEVNLSSWVMGRPEPLIVYGPKGVGRITKAVNDGYKLDRSYRVAHHGEALLNPALGVLDKSTIKPGIVFEEGDLKVTAYVATHNPIEPAVGYRFDYKGRSVVISGDSIVTEETEKITDGVDLLLHDALSLPVVSTLAGATGEAGLDRISKIMLDVMDYHASAASLVELNQSVDIGMVAFYHLVPNPANLLVKKIFERDLPSNFLLAEDGIWFELPPGSEKIEVTYP